MRRSGVLESSRPALSIRLESTTVGRLFVDRLGQEWVKKDFVIADKLFNDFAINSCHLTSASARAMVRLDLSIPLPREIILYQRNFAFQPIKANVVFRAKGSTCAHISIFLRPTES